MVRAYFVEARATQSVHRPVSVGAQWGRTFRDWRGDKTSFQRDHVRLRNKKRSDPWCKRLNISTGSDGVPSMRAQAFA